MTAAASDHARDARLRLQQEAATIGITRAYISTLVDSFYAEIRANEILGPVFAESVAGDWDTHLGTMKRFWASVALNSGEYAGKPVQIHQALATRSAFPLQQQHFRIWLSIFARVVADTAPTPEAEAFFVDRAARIASSLQMAIALDMPDRLDAAIGKPDEPQAEKG